MANIPMYDPQTSEIQSPLIAGLTEACNKISSILGNKIGEMKDFPLVEVFVSDDDRYRIYQAPLGNKLWLSGPAPVFKKNGIVMTPESDHFTIDYLGGSISFDEEYRLNSSDTVTVDASFIIGGSEVIESIKNDLAEIGLSAEKYKGYFNSYEELIGEYATGSSGDYAIVGGSENAIYIWNSTTKKWEAVEQNKLTAGTGITIKDDEINVDIPIVSLTLSEYEKLSNAEKQAEIQYIITDDNNESSGGVSSFNGRTGDIQPQEGDYTAEMVGATPYDEFDAFSSDTQDAVSAILDEQNSIESSLAETSSAAQQAASLSSNIYNRLYGNNISIGLNSIANIQNSIAIGTNSSANTSTAIAIGRTSSAKNAGSIALGISSSATANNAITLGTTSTASGINSIAIGLNSKASGINSVALGSYANASNTHSIALGVSASAIGNYSVALGGNAQTSSTAIESVAIGPNASTGSNHTIAIGANTSCSISQSIAIGYNAMCTGSTALALGFGVKSSNVYSTSIGGNSVAGGAYSTSIGSYSNAAGAYSTVLGYNSFTSNSSSIQLGASSSLSSITAKVSITVTSDERDKADITPIKDGALDFLDKIKAVQYVWNGREMYIDTENLSEEEKGKYSKYGMCEYDRNAHLKGTKKGARKRVGVLAQDVQMALKEVYGSANYANIVNDNLFDYDDVPDDVESRLGVTYENFIPFLIKAIQELNTRLKKLEGD